jgi:signal transduction histidine kinase
MAEMAGTMRDIARRMRRSPVITLVAENGQTLGGALCDAASQRRPFGEAKLWVEELVRADRRKHEFLATLAHELRNPPWVIRNAVGFLQREQGVTPAAQKAQALIERQVRRITRLFDDRLDVSRMRNGHLHLQRKRIDLVRSLVALHGGHVTAARAGPVRLPLAA